MSECIFHYIQQCPGLTVFDPPASEKRNKSNCQGDACRWPVLLHSPCRQVDMHIPVGSGVDASGRTGLAAFSARVLASTLCNPLLLCRNVPQRCGRPCACCSRPGACTARSGGTASPLAA